MKTMDFTIGIIVMLLAGMAITLFFLLGQRSARMDACAEKNGVFLRSEEVCVRMEVL